MKGFASCVRTASSRLSLNNVPVRRLNLHEFQSATIMREEGVRSSLKFCIADLVFYFLICRQRLQVTTPVGGVAKTPEEAYEIAKSIDSKKMVIKAQVQLTCVVLLVRLAKHALYMYRL